MSAITEGISGLKVPLQISFVPTPVDDKPLASNGGNVDLIAETCQFSNNGDEGLNNFYLITVTGSAGINLNGTLQLISYEFNFFPTNTKAKLIDYSPGTTIGNRSVSVGVSSTVSGSIGFFGGTGTASAGVSSSVSNSTTYSAPDVSISAKAYGGEDPERTPNNANWVFGVSPGSAVQNSQLGVYMQMLFMIACSDDAPVGEIFTVESTVKINLKDADGSDGTKWWDRMYSEVGFSLPRGSAFPKTSDRSGQIIFPVWPVNIKVPPLPST